MTGIMSELPAPIPILILSYNDLPSLRLCLRAIVNRTHRAYRLIVVDNAIIATGYNGTPVGVRNCADGGCPRCASDAPVGSGYDACICVHAEQNAILFAARHGNATQGGILYSTLRPCFGCLKEAIQAGLKRIVFAEPMIYQPELEDVYRRLVAEAGIELRAVVT